MRACLNAFAACSNPDICVSCYPKTEAGAPVSAELRTKEEGYSHIDYAEGICPGCKEPVDAYGNTAYDFKFCSYPDCGCDGARLCMAKEGPSDRANAGNVEGMWSGKTVEQRKAVFDLMESLK